MPVGDSATPYVTRNGGMKTEPGDMAASGAVVLVVDSIVFLWLAFGSLDYLAGQVIGKAIMVAASLPLVAWLRRRDRRIGLELR